MDAAEDFNKKEMQQTEKENGQVKLSSNHQHIMPIELRFVMKHTAGMEKRSTTERVFQYAHS